MKTCNCIKDIESKVLEQYPWHNKKKVEKARMETSFGIHEGEMICITRTNVNLTLAGQKKEIPVAVTHSFCPFCGIEHFPKDKEAETEETGETEQKK